MYSTNPYLLAFSDASESAKTLLRRCLSTAERKEDGVRADPNRQSVDNCTRHTDHKNLAIFS